MIDKKEEKVIKDFFMSHVFSKALTQKGFKIKALEFKAFKKNIEGLNLNLLMKNTAEYKGGIKKEVKCLTREGVQTLTKCLPSLDLLEFKYGKDIMNKDIY